VRSDAHRTHAPRGIPPALQVAMVLPARAASCRSATLRRSGGARELVGRIGRVDLPEEDVHGGPMNLPRMNLTVSGQRRLRLSRPWQLRRG
jgi:hypothetical protein